MCLSGYGVPWVGSDHSIVSHVDVSMPLICFHHFLTVFCQVRTLIFLSGNGNRKQSEVSRFN